MLCGSCPRAQRALRRADWRCGECARECADNADAACAPRAALPALSGRQAPMGVPMDAIARRAPPTRASLRSLKKSPNTNQNFWASCPESPPAQAPAWPRFATDSMGCEPPPAKTPRNIRAESGNVCVVACVPSLLWGGRGTAGLFNHEAATSTTANAGAIQDHEDTNWHTQHDIKQETPEI